MTRRPLGTQPTSPAAMRSRLPSMTSVSSPRSTSTASSNSGFCAGSDQPGGASIRATDTEALPVVAAPMNSSMRLPSSRGIELSLAQSHVVDSSGRPSSGATAALPSCLGADATISGVPFGPPPTAPAGYSGRAW